MTLLAVPNVSEGRDAALLDEIADAFARSPEVRLLDRHADPDHNRAVFTLAGPPGALAPALLRGARRAVERIDLTRHAGVHPNVGAVDVVPLVHTDRATRGAACAEALVTGEEIGERLRVPVLLYGALARGRTRAELRRGGAEALGERIAEGDVVPDFGPARSHPTAGATLLAARPPLVAFNLNLRDATPAEASAIAARIREGGAEGLPGLRAIGLHLKSQGVVQVSCNVEDPDSTPLSAVVDAVRAHAEIAEAEVVGLAPERAFDGFPADVPIKDFDPDEKLLERALRRG